MNDDSKHGTMGAGPNPTAPILVVPYMWIGDFVRCHTVVRLLRARFPASPIDVLTTTMVAPLLDYMPGVRHGIIWDLPRKPRAPPSGQPAPSAPDLRPSSGSAS